MSFWNSKKIKSTRKPHRCAYCHSTIPVGSSCHEEVGIYEGEFNHYYLCDRCDLFICLFHDSSETELGEFDDDLFNTDLLDCPECFSSNRRVYEFNTGKQAIELQCDRCDYQWIVDLSLAAMQDLERRIRSESSNISKQVR